MKYRAIIREAWAVTQGNKKLIWWFAFVPALLELLVGMVYLSYQAVSFWDNPYFREGAQGSHLISEVFTGVVGLFKVQPGLVVFGIVIVAIILLAYLFLPVFTQGSLIQLVAHIRAGRPVSVPEGISFGFNRFLQLFEYSLFIKTFSLVGIVTEASLALRILGPKPFEVLGWIFLLFMIVGLILTLLVTYSEYYIVIDKEGAFTSVVRSSGLVIRQWHHTLFMLLLMTVIIVRIALNLLVALLVPALVLGPIFFFTSTVLAKIGAVVGGIVGLVVLYFASYFLGVFHMFTTTVWTYTFLELTKEETNTVNLHEAPVHQHNEAVSDAE